MGGKHVTRRLSMKRRKRKRLLHVYFMQLRSFSVRMAGESTDRQAQGPTRQSSDDAHQQGHDSDDEDRQPEDKRGGPKRAGQAWTKNAVKKEFEKLLGTDGKVRPCGLCSMRSWFRTRQR